MEEKKSNKNNNNNNQQDEIKEESVTGEQSDYSVMSSLYKDAVNTQGFIGRTDEINHLTMLLNSIYHLNGRDDDYDTFYHRYITDYDDIQINNNNNIQQQIQNLEITDKNWQNYTNNKENYNKLQGYFQSKWELMGRKNILKIYLPVLGKNPFCGFFHPLIKLGHTTYLDDPNEISNSLAVWSCCYFKLNEQFDVVKFNKNIENSYSLEIIFDKLRDSKEMQILEFITGTHEERINKLFDNKEFYHLCQGYYYNNDETIKNISVSVCNFYKEKPCFATMHLVEACEGLRQVLQMINKDDDKEQILYKFILGVCATFVSIGCPRMNKNINISVSNLQSWNNIHSKALNSYDEHVVLFVHACTKLYYAFKGFKNYEIFRAAADYEVSLCKIS